MEFLTLSTDQCGFDTPDTRSVNSVLGIRGRIRWSRYFETSYDNPRWGVSGWRGVARPVLERLSIARLKR